MTALETQVGGSHYKSMAIQPMEFSMANELDACQHTIIKYVARFRDKGGIQDLEKAKHVIDMLIEFEGKGQNAVKALVQEVQIDLFKDNVVPLGTRSDRNIDLVRKADAAIAEVTGVPEGMVAKKHCNCLVCQIEAGLTTLRKKSNGNA